MGECDGMCLCRSLLRAEGWLPDVLLSVFFDCSFDKTDFPNLISLKDLWDYKHCYFIGNCEMIAQVWCRQLAICYLRGAESSFM